jgi:hypothetical protein
MAAEIFQDYGGEIPEVIQTQGTAPALPTDVIEAVGDVIEAPNLVPHPAEAYTVGQAVEARWRGHAWYPGHITAVNADGTVNVLFEDPMTEDHVPRDHVRGRPRPTTLQDLHVGQQVQANYRGMSAHFPGVVAGINADGTVNIQVCVDRQIKALGAMSKTYSIQ